MAFSGRYWRIAFSTSIKVTSTSLSLQTIQFKDENDEDIGLTHVPTITATSNATFDETNVVTNVGDGDGLTVASIILDGEISHLDHYGFVFDFGVDNEVAPTKIDMVFDNNTPIGAEIDLTKIIFYLHASEDGESWALASAVSAGLSTFDTLFSLPIDPANTIHFTPNPLTTGGTGGIYGIVSEDGIALPSRPVCLLDQETATLLGRTLTDQSGGYVFNGLNVARSYIVLSIDPSGAPYKKALVYDRIKPINTLGSGSMSNPFFNVKTRTKALLGYVGFWDVLANASSSFDIFQNAPLSTYSIYYYNGTNALSGYNLSDNIAADGSIRFITSNATPSYAGGPIHGRFTSGSKSGTFRQNNIDDYLQFTIETAFISPLSTENDLLLEFSGVTDTKTENSHYSNWPTVYHVTNRTICIEVTDTVINVRVNLSTANLSIVRLSHPITAGTMYHVAITYAMDDYMELFVDGVSVGTLTIAGSGRLYAHAADNSVYALNSWDNTSTGTPNTTISQITSFRATGEKANTKLGSGFGGAFGFAALYSEVLNAETITDLYDTYVDPSSVLTGATVSGYMAAVEQDVAHLYFKLNELSGSPSLYSGIGIQSTAVQINGTLGYGTGATFLYGAPSIRFNSGNLYLYHYIVPTVFSVETFFNCGNTGSSTANTILSTTNGGGANRPIHIYIADGNIAITIRDLGNVNNTIVTAAVDSNTNYHMVLSYDPWNDKSIKVILNGVKAFETVASVVPSTQYHMDRNFTSITSIGAHKDDANYPTAFSQNFIGSMSDFAIYDYALNETQAAEHYAARLT